MFITKLLGKLCDGLWFNLQTVYQFIFPPYFLYVEIWWPQLLKELEVTILHRLTTSMRENNICRQAVKLIPANKNVWSFIPGQGYPILYFRWWCFNTLSGTYPKIAFQPLKISRLRLQRLSNIFLPVDNLLRISKDAKIKTNITCWAN